MEMRGPRAVRAAAAACVLAALPPRLAAARAAWGLTVEQLPDPALVLPHVPDNLDHRVPLVAVNSGRMTTRPIDFTAVGDPVYRSTYPVRIYAWVKHEGHEECQSMRDDFGTVLRLTVLSQLTLATDGWITVAPETVVMDFSEVEHVKGDRFIGGVYVGFEVRATETLTDRLAAPGEGPRATVAAVNVAARILPPHPALEG